MNAPPLGPALNTLLHPVTGPVAHAAGEPVAAAATYPRQSSPRSDADTDASPPDPANEASDEIPRLTRLYAEETSRPARTHALTSLLGLLRADGPADESVLQYGPIARQPAQNDFAADMVVVQLQCTSLLARVEALEAQNTRAARTPDPGGNHRERGYHKHSKQRSREKQGARHDKMERNI